MSQSHEFRELPESDRDVIGYVERATPILTHMTNNYPVVAVVTVDPRIVNYSNAVAAYLGSEAGGRKRAYSYTITNPNTRESKELIRRCLSQYPTMVFDSISDDEMVGSLREMVDDLKTRKPDTKALYATVADSAVIYINNEDANVSL